MTIEIPWIAGALLVAFFELCGITMCYAADKADRHMGYKQEENKNGTTQ